MSNTRVTRNLLRNSISSVLRPRLPLKSWATAIQTRRASNNKDDLGGPGGQEPAPSKPAGPEAMKRNMPLYAGFGLLAVVGYAYMARPAQTARAVSEAKRVGGEEFANSMEQMSGKASSGQKAFRSE